ncbi:MAG: ribonuclease R [Acetobacterium sp.]
MRTKELKKLVHQLMEDPNYNKMPFEELSESIGLRKKSERQMLSHVLKELEKKKKNKNNTDTRVVKKEVITNACPVKTKEEAKLIGVLQGNQRGFGFVILDSAIYSEDIFIPEKYLHGALDQDQVWVKVTSKPGEKRPEGEVVEVIERGHKKIIGRYEKGKSFGFVIPDNDRLCKDIFIPERYGKDAVSGDKVVANILSWSDKGKNPEGEIAEILGNKDAPGIDILSVLKEYDIPMEFSKSVEKEANNIVDQITEADLKKRKDLREEVTFTIDGDDAKDYDDAVSIEKKENGHYILGVHIADVSHFVRHGSPLDESALDRGTSVYVVDRVVPMLPFNLSNTVCSLVPNEDRLTFSCEMEIDKKGKVLDYQIFKSVICSKSRMTYQGVSDVLAGIDNPVAKALLPFIDDLQVLEELFGVLHTERRLKRGAINFDFPEAKIFLDDKGFADRIEVEERLVSHRMIEECMLVANETVAKHVSKTKVPFLFRNHPEPDCEKLAAFRTFINRYGYKLGSKEDAIPKGEDYQKLMEDIEGKSEERVITLLMLRTMQQAVYQGHNLGHFALGAKYYTHFTSPIRRYPDLFVHRYLAKTLDGKLNEKTVEYLDAHIEDIGQHCSATERQAEKIEREITKLKMTEYMTAHIGETFEGRISGVTSFGFFVELPNTVEGLVRLQNMRDDYYVYDPDLHQHIGERTGKFYRLGQEVCIKVAKTDIDLKQIDFELVEKRKKA